jgi:inorganic pyrophosphatase/exopolyphosphatase
MNLEKLRSFDNIIIIGHKNPDTDSCLASVLVSNILNKMNIKAAYGIWEDDILSKQTKKMVNDVTSYKPLILKRKDVKKYHYFLVDHNDVKQSINDENLVIGVIDHHLKCSNFNNIVIKKLVSTTIVIYQLFRDVYNFNEEEKKMILMAAADDSAFGYSSRYNEESKKLILSLSNKDNFDEYFNKYFIETNMSDLLYAFNHARYKKYKFKKIEFESTGLEMLSDDYLDEYKEFILNNDHNFLGIYLNYKNKRTYIYFKFNNKFYEKKYDMIASRGSLIIADVLKMIESDD